MQSIIFFNNFYWAEYSDQLGKKCVVLFQDSIRKFENALFLTNSQALKLLSAHSQYGVDFEHRSVLALHHMLQKQSVRQHDTLKYGGINKIHEFMKDHPPEKKDKEA